HLPVLRLIHLGNFYIANFLGVPSWHVWMILGGIPMVVGLAWCFFLAFEKPFLHKKAATASS
ncbi:MAG TPA: hypothetical protein PKA06_09770, partial [Gemmatales bacterium]|nr:hypothetical protein [Gemmatales bacterium]